MSFNTVNTDEIKRKNEVEEIRGKLNALGMKFLDISKNEMAKTHARYMVGGRKFVSKYLVLKKCNLLLGS